MEKDNKAYLAICENMGLSEVRTLEIDGEPWFVAKDVCRYFGDTNYRRTIKCLEADERQTMPVQTAGGLQNMLVVNEFGFYGLLFAMRPQNNPKGMTAETQQRIEKLMKFRRWVTHDVLPTVRKYGCYPAPNEQTIEKLMEYYMTPEGLESVIQIAQKVSKGCVSSK